MFSPLNYFNLDAYEHADLFRQSDCVWNALDRLPGYLKQLPLGQILGTVSPKAHLVNPEQIFIGPGTAIQEGAYVEGPVYIGKDCQIRHGAFIRGLVLTGDGCVIGHDTEIKNSIFFNKTSAAHFAYLGDSILGHSVNLGAGVKCANLRLDRKAITLNFLNQFFETGRKKLGLIAGDGSQIGCNAVSNPGTIMGKNCFCHPLVNFGGVIQENMLIKSQNHLQILSRK